MSKPTKFILQIGLLLTPILTILIIIELFLWNSGEFKTAFDLADEALTTDILVGRGVISHAYPAYKVELLTRMQPKIIVAGSSRAMMYRTEMFDVEPGSFLNMGGTMSGISDLPLLVDDIKKKEEVEVLLLGVDFFWFNSQRCCAGNYPKPGYLDPANNWKAHGWGLRRLMKQIMTSPKLVIPMFSKPHTSYEPVYGVLASAKNTGYRNDGSRDIGKTYPDDEWEVSHLFENTLDIVKNDNGLFLDPLGKPDVKALKILDKELGRLRALGIEVIGIAPPIASNVMDEMLLSPTYVEFWEAFLVDMPDIFSRHGYGFLDVTDTRNLGLDDSYLLPDGYHAGETFYAVLLEKLTESGEAPNIYGVDGEWIRSELANLDTNSWFLSTTMHKRSLGSRE